MLVLAPYGRSAAISCRFILCSTVKPHCFTGTELIALITVVCVLSEDILCRIGVFCFCFVLFVLLVFFLTKAQTLFTYVLFQIFGTGSVAQMVLSEWKFGNFFSVNFSWGIGVAIGCYWAGGVSGGSYELSCANDLGRFLGPSAFRKVYPLFRHM